MGESGHQGVYSSSFEQWFGFMKKPVVYATAIASLLGPLQTRTAYADTTLKPGRDYCLSKYVKTQTELLGAIENQVRLYGCDVSQGIEVIVAALAEPSIGKEVRQCRNYSELVLTTYGNSSDKNHAIRNHTILLPQRLGFQLEDCLQRMNAVPDGSDYCAVCPQGLKTLNQDQTIHRNETRGYNQGLTQEQERVTQEVQPSCDNPVSDNSVYGKIHAERRGKSGAGPIIAVGAAVGLALLLGGAKRAIGGGGLLGGGGAGATGPGFSQGGTSVIPPLSGGAHR